MFTDQGAQKNFEGEEGDALARTALEMAQAELRELENTLGSRVEAAAAELKQRVDRKKEELDTAYDADTRRSIAEQSGSIRHEISKIKNRREHIADVLNVELDLLLSAFDTAIRPSANRTASEHFDTLTRQTRDAIARGNTEDARKSLSEMRSIGLAEAQKQPGFIVGFFSDLARERHIAVDKSAHDSLIAEGQICIDNSDMDGVRLVIGKMLENRYPIQPKGSTTAALAGLMR
jgi:molecular chaperone DnaK